MAKRKAGSLDGKLIYMSSVTDPYQPVDRELKLTRGILEIMAERHKPRLVVQTRSPTWCGIAICSRLSRRVVGVCRST